METVNVKTAFCPLCCKEHEIQILKLAQTDPYKGVPVDYCAYHSYCAILGKTFTSERQKEINELLLVKSYCDTSERIAHESEIDITDQTFEEDCLISVPEYLKQDLHAYKRALADSSNLTDCYWCELCGSINMAVFSGTISHVFAEYLKRKYLYGDTRVSSKP